MKKIIEEYWQLIVAIVIVTFICCLMFSGCSSINHLSETTKMVHDTVYCNSVVHDSVDRWHTHYEYLRGDTLHVIDTFWRDKWHVAHDTAYKTVVDVQTVEVEKVVKKKVYVWWPCLVLVGLIVAGGVWWLIERGFTRLARREGEQ